jgi:hypothetical protein
MIPKSSLFHQTRTPSGGEVKRHLLLLAVLVISVVSGAFAITRTHAAGETSNLSNRYLGNPQDVFPSRVYRGDGRSPEDIFSDGFRALGRDYDLEEHVMGLNVDATGYVRTNANMAIAANFAYNPGLTNMHLLAATATGCSTTQKLIYALIPVLGQFLLGSCIPQSNGTMLLTVRTYVYEIDPAYARNAYYVPTAIRANTALYNDYNHEEEWAYVDRIPTEAIVGTHVYQLTANRDPNDTTPYSLNYGIVASTLRYANLNLFLANPNYGGTTGQNPHYNPSNDTASGWNFDTDIDLPTALCPVDPTVFQHCG